jgi:hypothetical protein
MSTRLVSIAGAGALAGALLLVAPSAQGAPPTKEECVDAHGKGQDDREAGKLVEASKEFHLCGDAACPDLVRDDCARFADEIERLQPTVTFAARDGAQRDLIETAVFVDGALVASRLGDGAAHEIDPGHHTVRFVHAGQDSIVEVVVNEGEKGRAIVGTFMDPSTPHPASATAPSVPSATRPAGPLIVVGLGAAAAAAGGVLLGVGFAKLPSVCSLSTHECAAPPKAPVFDTASSAVTLVNVGAVVGGAGVVALTGSLIGYFAQPRRPAQASAALAPRLSPWVGGGTFGLSLKGSM